MARYEFVEGNHPGGSDDVAGRWYIVDTQGDIIDKRGRGWATRGEAAEALIERMTGYLGDDLVSVAEIAARAGVAWSTVQSWRRRHADFPQPIVTLAAGPIWRYADVADWLAVERKPGRPRKG